MNVSQVKNETILEILEFVAKVKADKYWPRKKQLFSQLSIRLSEPAQFLFSYCVSFSLFNRRWIAVDLSRYNTVKLSATNKTTFKDFLNLTKSLVGKRVTPTRERLLIDFLQDCDEQFYSFYRLLLERNFHDQLPATEIQTLFELDDICLDDTYADVQAIQGQTDLVFPVAITKIKNPRAMLVVQSRIANGTSWNRTLLEGKLTRVKTELLKEQKSFLKTNQYTIAGYLDSEDREIPVQKSKRIKTIESLKFIPVDIFKNYSEYKKYFDGGPCADFKARISKLNRFLHTNFTTQIVDDYIGYAQDELELDIEVRKVLGSDTSPTHLLLTNNDTARVNKIHAVECVRVQTIIDNYWVHEGAVLGFLAWHNGRLNKVSFDFSGKSNVLLNSLTLIKNKVLDSIYVDLGLQKVYNGVELKFNAKSWRVRPLGETGILLEKCAMCGSDDTYHEQGGLCKTCYNNLNYYYESYGQDVDIKPSKIMAKKRRASGWEYSLLNLVNFRYKGTYIECREDGKWKFRSDEKAELEYNFWLEKFGRN